MRLRRVGARAAATCGEPSLFARRGVLLQQAPMTSRYRFGLALGAAAVLLAYKSLTIAALAPGPILLGWALESATLITLWALTELPRASRYGRVLGAPLTLLFFALFYPLVISALAHTFFFESAAERRFSLLEIDLRTLAFFFRSVLPLRGTLLLTGLLLLMHLLAFPIARITRPLRPLRVGLGLAALWLALIVTLMAMPRVPSALADMLADVWEQLTTPQVLVDRSRPARYAPTLLDKSATLLPEPDAVAPRYDKVLVFVMETMTSATLEREQKALPSSTFVHSARAHGHEYTRYFATNQDSRTGMLSMLGSRFIPHEAYTEEGRDHYMFLGKKSSLVDHFHKLGYKAAFAVSQQEVELVVGDLSWDATLHLEEGETTRLGDKHLCFVPYEFEHSCEDRALLPRVLDYIDQHERVFLYQEFIWGHSSAYNDASGRTNTEYYSSYLDAVVQHLQQTGALDRTLIVLTSDHGFRDKGLQSDRAVYQIPLLFYAPRLSPARDARLFSHLDFKDLTFEELLPGAPPARESPLLLVVGPTGTSFVTVLTQSGQFMLLKARDGQRYLMHAEGFESAQAARQAAPDFLRLFDDYLAYFAAL
jgi:hypothetical protein